MSFTFFISLFVSVAFAQSPTPFEYLHLNAAPAVMIAIANAESHYQQFDASGNLLCDGVTHTHCGIFQIGNGHRKEAEAHGWDISTPEGNIAEALLLYSKRGTKDWEASYADKTNPNSWGQYFDRSGKPR